MVPPFAAEDVGSVPSDRSRESTLDRVERMAPLTDAVWLESIPLGSGDIRPGALGFERRIPAGCWEEN
jgi:hypothetical protein